MVTLEEGTYMRMIHLHFLIVSYKSVYNCIMGRIFFISLNISVSTTHMKMNYRYVQEELIIVHTNFNKLNQIHKTLIRDSIVTTLRRQ